MIFSASVILAFTALLGTITEAQKPSSVTVTSFPKSKRCKGASSSLTVAPSKVCNSFAGGANSYFVNVDSERCVLISYSDTACSDRIARRELEHDVNDDDQDCERLPKVAQSFKIKCGVDDHGGGGGGDGRLMSRFARHGKDDPPGDDHGHHGPGGDGRLMSRFARHGKDDPPGDDHGHHGPGGDGRLMSRFARHGNDDPPGDDHGHHHGGDDHGHHRGGDDHGHHRGDDHGHHRGGDDHGHHGRGGDDN